MAYVQKRVSNSLRRFGAFTLRSGGSVEFLEFDVGPGKVRVQPASSSQTPKGYQPAGISGDLVKRTGAAFKDALAEIAPAADAA